MNLVKFEFGLFFKKASCLSALNPSNDTKSTGFGLHDVNFKEIDRKKNIKYNILIKKKRKLNK